MNPLFTLMLVVVGLFVFRKIIWKITWHSVRFFLWRPKAVMLVIIAFLCFNTYGIWNAPDAPEMVPAPPPSPTQPAIAEKPSQNTSNKDFTPLSYPAELPPITRKVENGNSRFASNLLNLMGPNELQWYSRVFYHAMKTLPQGQTHQWLYQFGKFQMFGRITPTSLYHDDSGIICRNYNELLVINDRAQRTSGMACQRLGGGWCKLRKGSAHTCEIKPSGAFEGMWYDIKRSLRDIF